MSFGVFCCGFVWFVVIRWTSRDFLKINGGSVQVVTPSTARGAAIV